MTALTDGVGDMAYSAQSPHSLVFDDDLESIQASAKWTIAASGGIGVALLAGVQIGAIGRLADRWWLLAVVIAVLFVALWIVAGVVHAACLVLVDRITIGDLMKAVVKEQAHDKGIETGSSHTSTLPKRARTFRESKHKIIVDIAGEISSNRDWLLPFPHQDIDSLFHAYCQVRATDLTAAEALRGRLSEVYRFARTELARRRYADLVSRLTRNAGLALSVCLTVFATAVSWPIEPTSPPVTSPTNVRLLITGTPEDLKNAGLPPTCITGTHLLGVAIGGTLRAPVVVTEAAAGCPPHLITVTQAIGLASPVVK